MPASFDDTSAFVSTETAPCSIFYFSGPEVHSQLQCRVHPCGHSGSSTGVGINVEGTAVVGTVVGATVEGLNVGANVEGLNVGATVEGLNVGASVN